MKKTILRVQPIISPLCWFLLSATFVFILLLPQIADFSGLLWHKILYYSMFSLLCAVCLFLCAYYIQFAVVDDTGIKLYRVCFQIGQIAWKDCYSVTKEKLNTLDSRANILKWWIVIKKARRDEIKGGGKNRRGKMPLYIIATKKNIEVISKYHKVQKIDSFEEIIQKNA